MAEFGFEFEGELGGEGGASEAASAYARQLKMLLPRGPLFRLDPDSWMSKALLAIGEELARVQARGETLVAEWDARTALETLADWERVLGLPEAGATLPSVVSERQLDAALKLVARGGQTAAYYIDIAARLGFVATVVETGPHTWRMDVDLSASSSSATVVVSEFRAGSARAGDRVSNRSIALLETAINRAKPAHTVVTFNYIP